MAEQQITTEQVKHVAELAKLSFNDDELASFTTQLEDIIELFETLSEVDTTGVEATTSVTDRFNVLREDQAVNSNLRDALLANAPETEDGYIKVPAIIDESEDA